MSPAFRDSLLAFLAAVLPALGGWIAVEIRRRTAASLANTQALHEHADILAENTGALRAHAAAVKAHHKSKP
jgi:hypothetical protein